MTIKVMKPECMNETFAYAFNSRSIDQLLGLYETGAVLLTDGSGQQRTGLSEIELELTQLLKVPGIMTSHNHFCVAHGDLALLRADWTLAGEDSNVIASGSSAELVRKQADGRWLYVIDHAVGATLPRMDR